MSFFAESQRGIADILVGLFPYNPQPPVDLSTGLYWTDGSLDAFVGGNYRTVKQQRLGFDSQWLVNESNRIAYGLAARRESAGLNPFQGNWDADRLASTGELVPSSADNFIQRGFYIGGQRFDLLQPETRDIYGSYIQAERQLTERWTLSVGLRYDNYDDFGGNTSLRSGAVYNASNYFFKLLYGEAFRAPSFIETRAGIASGGIANPDLKPELVTTTEFVWGTHYRDWNTTLTLYNNRFSDVILPVLVDDVVPGITAFQPQNKGSETNTGVEFETNLQFSKAWKLSFGGDYVFDRFEAHPVADKRFYSRINYHHDDYQIGFSSHYIDKVVSRASNGNVDEVILDGHWLSHLNIRWSMFESMLLKVNANNLFNQENKSYTPQQGIELGLPGRGRHWMIGIEYRW